MNVAISTPDIDPEVTSGATAVLAATGFDDVTVIAGTVPSVTRGARPMIG
ncbi:hypothetical protein [Parafrankia discariae]|nr:hypothetical protein [Parafrankia discariae]